MVLHAHTPSGVVLAAYIGNHDAIATAIGPSRIKLNGILEGEKGKSDLRRLPIDSPQRVSFLKKIIFLPISCLITQEGDSQRSEVKRNAGIQFSKELLSA